MNPVRAARGLRIAHLIESDGPGGAEQVVVHLATALQADGASNVVFVPMNGEGWLARQLEGSGVAVDHFHIEQPVSPTCVRGLADAFRRHGVMLAHSHEFSMAVYGAWASRRVGIPHIITMHGSRYYSDRFRRRLALAAAMAMSRQTVAVSSPLARQLSRDLWLPRARVTTIANGVSWKAPARSTLREELGLAAEDQLLLSVGNLYPVKGHRHLIDAVALLADRYPRLHLAISGRGALEQALGDRARERNVADRVHLLGLRSDVPALLIAADIFVQPSLSEGLPLALLEAMFAGRPIVASDVGDVGIALARGDAGMLVPAANVDALASALDTLLADSNRASALGARAAIRASAEYDLGQMMRRYLAIYQRAIRGHSRTAQLPVSAHIDKLAS